MNGIVASGVVTSDGRPVVAQSPYAYGLGESAAFVGQSYVCAPGTSNHDMKVPFSVRLQGGYYWCKGPNLGDTVTLQVVDVDDVLGGGAGVVVSEYVVNMPLAPWDHQQELESATAGLVPAGLYLRVVYSNVGIDPVHVGVTYRWYVQPTS